ncbi:hypothetical protein LLS1_35430 [Leifsonia sp. LS1]|nr:hypothetical protein LLS1_35430 [Leifsonia sp. LS1]
MVIARTQDGIDANELATAITREQGLRRLAPFDSFLLPVEWAETYPRQARQVPHCAAYDTLETAQTLMTAFITPILTGAANGSWRPSETAWR